VVSPKKLSELKKQYNIELDDDMDTGDVQEIKGQVACPGLVTGKVRIILKAEDIKYFNEGEVLVSYMTMPTFIPAMKKAVAFVTDEGGITSHAAILSREMATPCIIGTKIATKLLKNGDLVEVDANKGVVNILQRV
jgi:pyruvate,water dikinase